MLPFALSLGSTGGGPCPVQDPWLCFSPVCGHLATCFLLDGERLYCKHADQLSVNTSCFPGCRELGTKEKGQDPHSPSQAELLEGREEVAIKVTLLTLECHKGRDLS